MSRTTIGLFVCLLTVAAIAPTCVSVRVPTPVETALAHFGKLVDELDELL